MNVEAARATAFSIFKFARVSESIGQFQLSDPVNHTAGDLARVRALVGVENLAVTVGLVLHEVAFEDLAVAEE